MRISRHIKNNFNLVLICLILSCILAEITIRILDIPPRPLEPLIFKNYRLSNDPIIAYEYKPNLLNRVEDKVSGFSTNSDGFRDNEFNINKAKNTFRIIVIGDSTTAGNGVADYNKTYPKVLEKNLNSQFNKDMKVEVYNMGVGGYHTMQEVQTLKSKGLKFNPDLILLTVCQNDDLVNSDGGALKYLLRQEFKNNLRIMLGDLINYSRLFFIINHIFFYNLDDANLEYKTKYLDNLTPFKAGLYHLQQIQISKKIPVVVAILPYFRSSADFSDEKYFSFLSEVQRYSQFKSVDLAQEFLKKSTEVNSFSFDGVHLNEMGHETYANILTNRISQFIK